MYARTAIHALNIQGIQVFCCPFQLGHVVYKFCERWNATYPIKGYQDVNKKDGIDRASTADFRRYKRSKVNSDTVIYNISTNYYKNTIYNNLKIILLYLIYENF